MSLTLKMKALVEAAAFTGFGQTTPVTKVRNWRTDVVSYDSGVEQRQQVLDQPIRGWMINWSLLDAAGRDQLREIFDAARGTCETFQWLDDDEYLCSSEQIATDGSETAYQLVCTYHSGETYEWTETKKDIVPGTLYAPVVTHSVDGAAAEVAAAPGANEFTLDDTTGIMTFGVAPSSGVLTCTYEYYFRVRFVEDIYTDLQFAAGPLYSAADLQIKEVMY
ncbi:MAG TPA: DUF2460 domain-containing protein [Sedimentisphaerales bacterium]|nr:DUF2460 domain-containing protein [Sedimentisphaerales bacterium]